MKISIQWLKNYVSFKLSSQEIAHRLTLSGMEVEQIETVGEDTVLTLEITPNRPDCLHHVGLARELSAILNKPLKKPSFRKVFFPKEKCSVTVEKAKDCQRYVGAVLGQVKISSSANMIKNFLTAVDIRPINNVVDFTNFCMMELGQPMHAFDFDKLEGGKIVVRRARSGESIVTLDGNEHKLDPSILVIADERKPVAIAGIMGGKDAEVTSQTKNILLESAVFDPALVRQASRKLGLRTESSYRFERGVDAGTTLKALERAVALICETAEAETVSLVDVQITRTKKPPKIILVSAEQIEQRLGVKLTAERIKKMLMKLECQVRLSSKGLFRVVAPSFRQDLKEDVDIIEEIARIIGFDRLPMRLPLVSAVNVEPSRSFVFKEELAQRCCGLGLSEMISYAMISQKALSLTTQNQTNVVLNQKPLSEEQAALRPSMLPSALDVAARNVNQGRKDLRLFEIGKIYLTTGEEDVLSVVMTGARTQDWRINSKDKIDFYDLKGILQRLFESLKVEACQFVVEEHASLEQGKAATIMMDNKEIGFLGQVSSELLEVWGIKHQDVYFAQVHLASLVKATQKIARYCKISGFPSTTRDVSLAVPTHVSFDQVRQVIDQCQQKLLCDVSFVEQYQGDKISQGFKGMTLSLTYQSQDKTLTDSEVEQAHGYICEKILSTLEAVKR